MASTKPKPEASEKKPNTALAIASPAADEAALAALAEAGIEPESDGMAEMRPSDFRTPMKQFNLKGKQDVNGGRILQDMFFDTIDQTTAEQLNFALLEIHKSNSWTEFDNAEQRNRRMCASFDQITGTLSDGTPRPCKGCPDAQWKTQKDGKRRANCAEVWDAFGYDLDGQKIFMIRFKKTSLDAPRNYVQAHHLGKRPLPGGKRGNMPLFTYRVHATLKMDKSGNYAVPVLERGEPFSAADLKVLAETSAGVRETLRERLQDAEASAAATEGDTSFDTDAYGSEGGGTPPSGAASGGGAAFIDG
jgi:hypothetical protein